MKTLAIMAIPLSQELFALLDGEDYEELSKFKWYAFNNGNTYYAVRNERKYPKQKTIMMHRQILNAQIGDETDHHSHYGLDNRKQNIRFCTHSQNNQNRLPYKDKSSRFKGVCWYKRYGKWLARIKHNGKSIHLGYFAQEINAAEEYDHKAKELFSEFAHTNF